MAIKNHNFQTLQDFLQKPFGQIKPDTSKFDAAYESMMSSKSIKCDKYCKINNSYLFLVQIPSESKSGEYYEVVIQFFTKKDNANDPTLSFSLERYYLQFYSNSPSFIYKYSAIYKTTGYLINVLYDRLGTKSNSMPTKTNPDMNMTYDKSIYIACRYLWDHRLRLLSFNGMRILKQLPVKDFLKEVRDYDTVMDDLELFNLEKGLQKELEKEKRQLNEEKLSKPHFNILEKLGFIKPKIKATNNTLQNKDMSAIKKVQKKSAIRPVKKKTSKKSTYK